MSVSLVSKQRVREDKDKVGETGTYRSDLLLQHVAHAGPYFGHEEKKRSQAHLQLLIHLFGGLSTRRQIVNWHLQMVAVVVVMKRERNKKQRFQRYGGEREREILTDG